MSLVNLGRRTTAKWEQRCENLQSPHSLIYVKDKLNENVDNQASMEISVGEVYIIPGDNKPYRIPKEGLVVRPKESVVVFSEQKLALPYNVFGVVTGKGNYIFQGCFISSGKIDPGFDGYLKVGFYNGGHKDIVLTSGCGFASLYFINTEFTMSHALENYQTAPPPHVKKINPGLRCYYYIRNHIIGFISWALIALPAAIFYIKEILK